MGSHFPELVVRPLIGPKRLSSACFDGVAATVFDWSPWRGLSTVDAWNVCPGQVLESKRVFSAIFTFLADLIV